MPINPAPTTSHRLLTLLSLLQARRDWPGGVLADRLGVSERTVRRDVDRLREIGYEVSATRGTDGGYRLDPGARMPPLLFDDDQVVALSVALQTATASGADIREAADRALATVRQVMPSRLRVRLDALRLTTSGRRSHTVEPSVLLAIGAAIGAHEELRFDYPTDDDDANGPPRLVQPHHLVARHGRWYLLAWNPERADWRTYRVDRVQPRVPTGPKFEPRTVPGGDIDAFVESRFRGSDSPQWPCRGEVVVHLPIGRVAPFVEDGSVVPVDDRSCRLTSGSWSWPGLAASLARFDADLDVLGPDELRAAFAELAVRAQRAGRPSE